MTWPDRIAAAIGLTTALLITIHQHRSTTQPLTEADIADGLNSRTPDTETPKEHPEP